MGIAERKAREFKRRERDILDAAFTLFMENGPEGVTNEMIAEVSEIGKGTIYKHFKSKSDIYAVLLIEHVEELHDFIKENLDFTASTIEKIREFTKLHISFFNDNPGAHKICCEFRRFLADESLDPAVARRYQDMYRRKNLMLEKLFDEALQQGLVVDLPASDLTALVSGMLLGVMNEMSHEFISDQETLSEALVESIMKSVSK
jgi:AcrR family transcriptional regulator